VAAGTVLLLAFLHHDAANSWRVHAGTVMMPRGVRLIDVSNAESARTLVSVVLIRGRSGLDLVGCRSRLWQPPMLIPVPNALWTIGIAIDRPSGVARIRPTDDDSTPGGIQQTTSLLRGPVILGAAPVMLMMPDLDHVRIHVIGRVVLLLQHRAHSVHATDRSAEGVVLDGVNPL